MSPFTSMKLIFLKTGDELHFQETNNEFLEYYLDKLDSNNIFIPNKTKTSINRLRSCIDKIDNFFVSKLNDTTFSNFNNLHRQSVLNNLHKVWVKKQLENPMYTQLLEKVNLLETFRDINEFIHEIEEHNFAFIYKNTVGKHGLQYDNPFGTKILNFNRCNISLTSYNLGRQTFDKWWKYDDNVIDTDTNDHYTLSGRIRISLERPQTLAPPIEYVDWCKSNKIDVIGYRLGLGNFTANIDTQRDVFERNRQNNFKII